MRGADGCFRGLGSARLGSFGSARLGPGAAGRHWLWRAGRGPASIGQPPPSPALPGPARLQQAAAAARAAADRALPPGTLPLPVCAIGKMIGVNSINSSAGRMRSRSMCSVRYGRNYRGVETFCYGWPQRSRTLKPVLYTDLVVSRLQNRRKKKPVSGGLGSREGSAGGYAAPTGPLAGRRTDTPGHPLLRLL